VFNLIRDVEYRGQGKVFEILERVFNYNRARLGKDVFGRCYLGTQTSHLWLCRRCCVVKMKNHLFVLHNLNASLILLTEVMRRTEFMDRHGGINSHVFLFPNLNILLTLNLGDRKHLLSLIYYEKKLFFDLFPCHGYGNGNV